MMDAQRISLGAAEHATRSRGLILVRSSRLATIRGTFARVSKKAAKYGQPPLSLIEGASVEVFFPAVPPAVTPGGVVLNHGRRAFYANYTEVKVEGDSFRINGWRPVLRMERTDDGATFFAPLGDAHLAIPTKYREPSNDALPCEHCGTRRRRKAAYVLVDETGAWKLVGSTCLVDFTGHPDAEGLAAAIADYARAARGADEDDAWMGGSYVPDTFDTGDVLALTARYIRAFGWASRKQSEEAAYPMPSTASLVRDRMTAASKEEVARMKKNGVWLDAEPVDEKLAEETRAATVTRLEAIDAAKVTEFEHNLLVALKSDSCPIRVFGTVCALFAVAERYKTKEQQDAERAARLAKAKHVAEEGKRLDLDLRVVQVRDLGDGDWGRRILYKFEDQSGNLYVWFSSKMIQAGLGERITARATIKGHREFRGVKENQVSRLTVKEYHEEQAPEGWAHLPVEERAYQAAKKGWTGYSTEGIYFIEHGRPVPATRHVGRDARQARKDDDHASLFLEQNREAIHAGVTRWRREVRARQDAAGIGDTHEAEDPLSREVA